MAIQIISLNGGSSDGVCSEQRLIRSQPGGPLSARVLPVLTGLPAGTHPLPVLCVWRRRTGSAGPLLWPGAPVWAAGIDGNLVRRSAGPADASPAVH